MAHPDPFVLLKSRLQSVHNARIDWADGAGKQNEFGASLMAGRHSAGTQQTQESQTEPFSHQ
jgi:hypothetical protein